MDGSHLVKCGWKEWEGTGRRVQKEGLVPYLGPIGVTLLALKPTNYNFFYGLKLVQEVTLGGLSWARDFLGLGQSVNGTIVIEFLVGGGVPFHSFTPSFLPPFSFSLSPLSYKS